MSTVELVVDTNVVSYLFQKSALGLAYERLIGGRRLGVTGSTLAELHRGSAAANWGIRRRQTQIDFLQGFIHLPETREMSEICGSLRAKRARLGRPIDWADAWAAACAIWADVPLVTHDRDLEGIPGLRVETLHSTWRVGDSGDDVYPGGELAWFASDGRWAEVRGRAPQ